VNDSLPVTEAETDRLLARCLQRLDAVEGVNRSSLRMDLQEYFRRRRFGAEHSGPVIRNDARHLRHLLTDLYVAVLGYLPLEGDEHPIERISADAWDAMMTTVLDAGEGRRFAPLGLPWPPIGGSAEGVAAPVGSPPPGGPHEP